MITAYISRDSLQAFTINETNLSQLNQAVWIDIISPSQEEELMLEHSLSLDLPTREEMREIELSSRLYKNKDAIFMTASMLAYSQTPDPMQDAITFILTSHQLITLRYIEPQAFKLFISQLQRLNLEHNDATTLLIELLEATIDRLADILETIGHHLELTSKKIFKKENPPEPSTKPNYQHFMQEIGINADLNSKARESLVTFSRLIPFFSQSADEQLNISGQTRLNTLSKDINSLSDHANFLSSKVNFLLDATLGMINIEQNAIIKIFSIAAVIFLPPTLIASIYGMNFQYIPELSFKWGYYMAIGLIALSAYIPYKFFKIKKWL